MNLNATFSIFLGTVKAACDLIDGLDKVEVTQIFVIIGPKDEVTHGVISHLPSRVKFKSLLKYD